MLLCMISIQNGVQLCTNAKMFAYTIANCEQYKIERQTTVTPLAAHVRRGLINFTHTSNTTNIIIIGTMDSCRHLMVVFWPSGPHQYSAETILIKILNSVKQTPVTHVQYSH